MDSKIRVHPQMVAIIGRFGEDGWINAPFTYEEGWKCVAIGSELA